MEISLRNRAHAGRALAGMLSHFNRSPHAMVMAVPLGGLPVAVEIARALHLPLDVCVARKLWVPSNPDLAMGAVASGGVLVLNAGIVQDSGVPRGFLEREVALEREEVEIRERVYRRGLPQPDLAGKTVIVADDGVVTGATMDAVIRALQQRHAQEIVIATGVISQAAARRFLRNIEVYSALRPEHVSTVSECYEEFPRISNAEALELLRAANEAAPASDAPGGFDSNKIPTPPHTEASPGHS